MHENKGFTLFLHARPGECPSDAGRVCCPAKAQDFAMHHNTITTHPPANQPNFFARSSARKWV